MAMDDDPYEAFMRSINKIEEKKETVVMQHGDELREVDGVDAYIAQQAKGKKAEVSMAVAERRWQDAAAVEKGNVMREVQELEKPWEQEGSTWATVLSGIAPAGIVEKVQDAVAEENMSTPFKTVSFVVPRVVTGSSLVMVAPKGAGKSTCSAVCAVIHAAERRVKGPRMPTVVAVSPSREGANNLFMTLLSLCNKLGLTLVTFHSGCDREEQYRLAKKGFDIAVGTPGGLLAVSTGKSPAFTFTNTSLLVVDDAGAAFAKSFETQMDQLADQCARKDKRLFYNTSWYSPRLDHALKAMVGSYGGSAHVIEFKEKGTSAPPSRRQARSSGAPPKAFAPPAPSPVPVAPPRTKATVTLPQNAPEPPAPSKSIFGNRKPWEPPVAATPATPAALTGPVPPAVDPHTAFITMNPEPGPKLPSVTAAIAKHLAQLNSRKKNEDDSSSGKGRENPDGAGRGTGWERSRDRDNSRGKDRDRSREWGSDRKKDRKIRSSSSSSSERSKSKKKKTKDTTRERSRSNDRKRGRRDRSRSRSRDKSRDKKKDGRGRDRSRERSRDRSRDRDRKNDKNKPRKVRDRSEDSERRDRTHRKKDNERNQERSNNRDGSKDRDRDRDREKDKKRGRDRSRSRDRDTGSAEKSKRNRDKSRSRSRSRDKKRSRERSRDREKTRNRERNRDRSRSRDKKHDKEKSRDRDGSRNRERRDRERSRGRERSRVKDKRGRERSRENRSRSRSRSRDNKRDRSRSRSRSRDETRSKDRCDARNRKRQASSEKRKRRPSSSTETKEKKRRRSTTDSSSKSKRRRR
eukprot:TRINITY_DN8456_c0_g2_i1.p1 TRINITY_DN8456_c0_g2~~TRINITY_DN8456_c0_g2_i1.p1  ORF type:complete len:802 (+),score=158.74 TRINITY_DN8456_c0_g2_i1:34-2439(+)